MNPNEEKMSLRADQSRSHALATRGRRPREQGKCTTGMFGGRSSTVERCPVEADVAGSNPVGHPEKS